jgi:hypothetical protein
MTGADGMVTPFLAVLANCSDMARLRTAGTYAGSLIIRNVVKKSNLNVIASNAASRVKSTLLPYIKVSALWPFYGGSLTMVVAFFSSTVTL